MTLPRFSLRILLLAVAVLCAWLAWERSVVMERRASLDRWLASGSFAYDPGDPANLSWIRRCLGDIAVASVYVSRTHEPEVFDAARRIFPDAEFQWAEITISDGTQEVFILESRDAPSPYLAPSVPPLIGAPLPAP